MSRRAPPKLSERDVAEIEAFAQLLDLQAARPTPDATPWALDVAAEIAAEALARVRGVLAAEIAAEAVLSAGGVL